MNKKYELVENDTKIYALRKLYRIKSLISFSCNGYLIIEGDLGGYIEKEDNLSQDGNCWIFSDSVVFDNARINDNAIIKGHSVVQDNAKVFGNALIKDSNLYDYAMVRDAKLIDNIVDSNATISCIAVIGACYFSKNAKIRSLNDYINIRLEGGSVTFYRNIKNKIGITYCFPSELEFFGGLNKFKKFIESNKKSIDYNRAKSLIDFAESRLK